MTMVRYEYEVTITNHGPDPTVANLTARLPSYLNPTTQPGSTEPYNGLPDAIPYFEVSNAPSNCETINTYAEVFCGGIANPGGSGFPLASGQSITVVIRGTFARAGVPLDAEASVEGSAEDWNPDNNHDHSQVSDVSALGSAQPQPDVKVSSGVGQLPEKCTLPSSDSCNVSGGLFNAQPPVARARDVATQAKSAPALKLASIGGTIRGGRTGKLTARLNAAGKKLLARKHRLTVYFVGIVRDRHGATEIIDRRITLRS
jgi:hypothetical protein